MSKQTLYFVSQCIFDQFLAYWTCQNLWNELVSGRSKTSSISLIAQPITQPIERGESSDTALAYSISNIILLYVVYWLHCEVFSNQMLQKAVSLLANRTSENSILVALVIQTFGWVYWYVVFFLPPLGLVLIGFLFKHLLIDVGGCCDSGDYWIWWRVQACWGNLRADWVLESITVWKSLNWRRMSTTMELWNEVRHCTISSLIIHHIPWQHFCKVGDCHQLQYFHLGSSSKEEGTSDYHADYSCVELKP